MTARSKFVFQTASPAREQSVQNVVLVPQNPLVLLYSANVPTGLLLARNLSSVLGLSNNYNIIIHQQFVTRTESFRGSLRLSFLQESQYLIY